MAMSVSARRIRLDVHWRGFRSLGTSLSPITATINGSAMARLSAARIRRRRPHVAVTQRRSSGRRFRGQLRRTATEADDGARSVSISAFCDSAETSISLVQAGRVASARLRFTMASRLTDGQGTARPSASAMRFGAVGTDFERTLTIVCRSVPLPRVQHDVAPGMIQGTIVDSVGDAAQFAQRDWRSTAAARSPPPRCPALASYLRCRLAQRASDRPGARYGWPRTPPPDPRSNAAAGKAVEMRQHLFGERAPVTTNSSPA